ncbi:adenosylmethionine--8-amino-7-oxononanoate transaminase [Cardiobacteriaceae bacterium TAE3-ERU3]|nr:adenosylmethionine--8-amino-7-oxononanoate transaminase [Cardiobacteriaceae bacterium TAE3-ERU3]
MASAIQQFDSEHIWHPYASAHGGVTPYVVSDAEGVYLTLEDGRKLIDGMSSWWCVIHGYKHPVLNAAIQEQCECFAHVMFGGLTHEPAVQLARDLLDVVPQGLARVFFCDSGSVSVEVAMKMALQYQQARGETQRVQFATVLGGYHGDTWHPMSVCDPHTGMHSLYQGRLAAQHFLPRPQSRFDGELCADDVKALDGFFAAHGDEVAAFIIEPIVQGAGGMWFYHPDYLRHLAERCRKHGILLIADEIATGFGRTGEWFAINHAVITPDIMCIGKALTGGYVSFAATLCTDAVADTISAAEPGVMMHGPTFMGNPLACAVASASLGLLRNEAWREQVAAIAAHLQAALSPLKDWDAVADVRVLGAIGVVELHEAVDMAVITPMFVEAGVWVRPFGKLVYLMPPFVISAAELQQLSDALVAVLKAYCDV